MNKRGAPLHVVQRPPPPLARASVSDGHVVVCSAGPDIAAFTSRAATCKFAILCGSLVSPPDAQHLLPYWSRTGFAQEGAQSSRTWAWPLSCDVVFVARPPFQSSASVPAPALSSFLRRAWRSHRALSGIQEGVWPLLG